MRRAAKSAALLLVLAGCIPADPRFAPPPTAPLPASDLPAPDLPAEPPPEREPEQAVEAPHPLRPSRPQRRAPVEQLAAARPAWEAAPITPDARLVRTQDVVVRAGDTLSAIAERTGASIEAIARRNTLSPPLRCAPGSGSSSPAGDITASIRGRPGSESPALTACHGARWLSPTTCASRSCW
ncbi:LysM peptidoglycan-binding domain-containing protein [Sphingomonas sp. LR60]|uniref:LysM peptidoglycan-binding domain-containing protein n=1 Tax=Sphingomonas sp. LR60 TaxID=3050233 RepID=UPI002FDF0D95